MFKAKLAYFKLNHKVEYPCFAYQQCCEHQGKADVTRILQALAITFLHISKQTTRLHLIRSCLKSRKISNASYFSSSFIFEFFFQEIYETLQFYRSIMLQIIIEKWVTTQQKKLNISVLVTLRNFRFLVVENRFVDSIKSTSVI